MARFTVVWAQEVEDRLVDIWLQASDRERITAATNRIDTELSDDASGKGILISEGLRTLRAAPLQVLFEVCDDDRVAKVVAVRYVGVD